MRHAVRVAGRRQSSPSRPADDVGDDHLAPAIVREADDDGVGDPREAGQHLFDLGGMHVLSAGDDHVVLAADDRHVLVLVPDGEVARVQPAVEEFALVLLRAGSRTRSRTSACAR